MTKTKNLKIREACNNHKRRAIKWKTANKKKILTIVTTILILGFLVWKISLIQNYYQTSNFFREGETANEFSLISITNSSFLIFILLILQNEKE